MWSTMILTRETVNMSKAEKLADSFMRKEEHAQAVKEGRVRTCRTCNEQFTITRGERGWFQERGWHLPASCARCRKIARQERRRLGWS